MSLKSSVGDTDASFIEGKISEASVTTDNSNCQWDTCIKFC